MPKQYFMFICEPLKWPKRIESPVKEDEIDFSFPNCFSRTKCQKLNRKRNEMKWKKTENLGSWQKLNQPTEQYVIHWMDKYFIHLDKEFPFHSFGPLAVWIIAIEFAFYFVSIISWRFQFYKHPQSISNSSYFERFSCLSFLFAISLRIKSELKREIFNFRFEFVFFFAFLRCHCLFWSSKNLFLEYRG